MSRAITIHLYGIFNEDHSLVYAEVVIGCSTCR